MAEAILFNVTADIIFKLGSFALREFGLLWGVKDELDKLKDSLSAIQAELLDAEERQSNNLSVKDWVSKLKDTLYDIDDLMDEFSYEALRRQIMTRGRTKTRQVRIFFSKSNQIVFRHKIAHKIKEIRERLKAIHDDKTQFGFSRQPRRGHDDGLRRRRDIGSYIPEQEVIGRNNDKEAVIDLLMNTNTTEDIAIISVVGMGGLGKTALAQSIYNHNRIANNQFQLKLWVCVSEEFDLKIIIQKIIESATKKIPESSFQMDTLENELKSQIDGKKYLLIMDDVWNEKKGEWLRLKRLLMGGAKGSRILITTRSEQVAKTFDTTFLYSLQILDLSNSLLLFQKMTYLEGSPNNQEELDHKNSNLMEIGMTIVPRLKGVPLVIRTIGALLKDNKSEKFWLSFQDKELYQVLGQEQDDLKEMRLILELSYKYLPANLKQCFLYCALFPKDYEIRKDELILLWRAQGLIQPNDNNDDNLIDIGGEYFMELLSRSFFQEVKKNDLGDIKACKMHDLMHDLACSITHNECVCDLNGIVIDKRTRHFSWKDRYCHEDQLLGTLSKSTNLRTFLMLACANDLKWDLGNIFHDHLKLRTLHLNLRGYETKKAMFLDFTGKLKHLRYLGIIDSEITTLPDSITKLYNLETFILQNSRSLEKLPSEMKNLIKLKHLDLSNNNNLKFLPDSITELCKLEALILVNCRKLEGLPEDTKKMINLKHLDLYGCSALTHIPKGLGELSDLQIMTRFVLGKNKGGELKELDGLTKLKGTLSIDNLEFCTSVDRQTNVKLLQLKSGLQQVELNWGNFRNEPTISELDDVICERVLDCLQPHSNLQKISIEGYKGVKLCNWISSNSLGRLVTIRFESCERLQHLPRLDEFPSLKHLYLVDLPNIEYIMVNNDDSISSPISFPSLEEFHIAAMPKLERWWKGTTLMESPIKFPCLSDLIIYICPLHILKSWHAPNLKSLTIRNLEDETLDIVPWKVFENLSALCLFSFDKLQYLPECFQHYMTALQLLCLHSCKNLQSLPEWIGNLTSLTILDICNCEKLTFLPEGIRHIKGLQRLKITGCPMLKERCEEDTGEDWPKIAHIRHRLI